jgi:hypothetical protein
MGWNLGRFVKVIMPLCLLLAGGLYLYDLQKLSQLPKFRSTDMPFKKADGKALPTREGLEMLNISGSRRPTQGGLIKYLGDKNMPVYSFDLQLEGHYFIKGSPERWFGYQRVDTVGVDDKNASLRHYIRRLIHTGKFRNDPQDVQSEKEMTEAAGFHYVGICQTRHRVPLAEQVDLFIESVNNIPQPAWIHFHCNGGRSRTTIAMVMYDIMKNGTKVSLQDIVQRHKLLGGEDLFDTEVWKNGSYTKDMLEVRKAFIEDFYRFVNDPGGYGVTSWQDWSTKHKVYGTQIY